MFAIRRPSKLLISWHGLGMKIRPVINWSGNENIKELVKVAYLLVWL